MKLINVNTLLTGKFNLEGRNIAANAQVRAALINNANKTSKTSNLTEAEKKTNKLSVLQMISKRMNLNLTIADLDRANTFDNPDNHIQEIMDKITNYGQKHANQAFAEGKDPDWGQINQKVAKEIILEYGFKKGEVNFLKRFLNSLGFNYTAPTIITGAKDNKWKNIIVTETIVQQEIKRNKKTRDEVIRQFEKKGADVSEVK